MWHVQTPERSAPRVRTAPRGVPHGIKARWYLPAALFIDVAGTGFPVAVLFTTHFQPWPVPSAVATAGAWVAVRTARSRYTKRSLGESRGALPVLHDWLILVGVLAVVRAAGDLRHSQLICLAALLPALVATLFCRKFTYRHLARARRRAHGVTRVLLLGEPAAADDVAGYLAARTDHPYVVVGAVAVGAGELSSGIRVAARLGEQMPEAHGIDLMPVLGAALELEADVALVAPGRGLSGERLRRISWGLHDAGLELAISPGLLEVAVKRVETVSAAGMALLRIVPPVRRGMQPVLKAVMDRGGAILGLIVLSPLLLLVAAAVRGTSAGPVFYRSERIGQGGVPFLMWKFRSMHVNADARKAELAEQNENDGAMFKMRRDPRVTRVGRILRRTSLDELPQLINVAYGEMSLVGPRPPLADEVALYSDVERRRLNVRPGMTGLWQISGRSDLSWDETVALDLSYVDNWSFTSDVDVMARTLRAVVDGRGAY
ncbi:exopolysaccharide biosynthesis polyprenyl glycosylphosphotransferase [Streptomyces tsukubensis]|uniref:Glycosyl transferase n=1 Tax=Streptomyces tsukubensis TaxID=83656 RepID=A0A1V4A350_9ACTN|nr:glycosyl transferase [Streptomyces tsukubensis]QFR96737.1 exopolysaccharide biosynthesis polyprenyl glycosylphosphotransferase [Streptomyces tsukubensis]